MATVTQTGSYVNAGTFNDMNFSSYRLTCMASDVSETDTTITIRVRVSTESSIRMSKTITSTTYVNDFYMISRVLATNVDRITPYRTDSTKGYDAYWEPLTFHGDASGMSTTASAYAHYNGSFTAVFTKSTAARNETFTVHLGMSKTPDNPPSTNSTATFTFNIPERTKYAITYNNNGGSGTIATAYKYYDVPLTLASSGFTRNLYRLDSWNTLADGTGGTYALGGTYTANAGATLYAKWQYLYTAPEVKTVTAIRVANASATTASEEGTYIRVTFTYSSAIYDGNLQSTTFSIKINGTTPTSGSTSGTLTNSSSGTYTTSVNCYVSGGYSVNNNHTITVTLSNTTGGSTFTASKSTSVSTAIYPMDILETGKAMGIMMPAQAGWYVSVPNLAIQLGAGEALYTAITSLGWTSDVTTKDYSTS